MTGRVLAIWCMDWPAVAAAAAAGLPATAPVAVTLANRVPLEVDVLRCFRTAQWSGRVQGREAELNELGLTGESRLGSGCGVRPVCG